jgi:hypothetical protein
VIVHDHVETPSAITLKSAFTFAEMRKLYETPAWVAKREVGLERDATLIPVLIDVRAPEELLMSAFKNWLRATKAAALTGVDAKGVSATTFDDLQKYQVLPYLDLSYWARVHGVRLTYQQKGLALFPEDFEVALSERVRKVVMPLAHRVTTVQYVDSLHVQLNMSSGAAKKMPFLSDACKRLLDDPLDAVRFIFPSLGRER